MPLEANKKPVGGAHQKKKKKKTNRL
jgi:hypothetical protein